jgi:hypothetical protein
MGRDSKARQGYAARQYSQSQCSALRSAVDHAHHRRRYRSGPPAAGSCSGEETNAAKPSVDGGTIDIFIRGDLDRSRAEL